MLDRFSSSAEGMRYFSAVTVCLQLCMLNCLAACVDGDGNAQQINANDVQDYEIPPEPGLTVCDLIENGDGTVYEKPEISVDTYLGCDQLETQARFISEGVREFALAITVYKLEDIDLELIKQGIRRDVDDLNKAFIDIDVSFYVSELVVKEGLDIDEDVSGGELDARDLKGKYATGGRSNTVNLFYLPKVDILDGLSNRAGSIAMFYEHEGKGGEMISYAGTTITVAEDGNVSRNTLSHEVGHHMGLIPHAWDADSDGLISTFPYVQTCVAVPGEEPSFSVRVDGATCFIACEGGCFESPANVMNIYSPCGQGLQIGFTEEQLRIMSCLINRHTHLYPVNKDLPRISI